MRRDMINEDSNQFGPGTDLIICLLALVMVFVLIVAFLYGKEKKTSTDEKTRADNLANIVNAARAESEESKSNYENELEKLKGRGRFERAGEFRVTATFKMKPYYTLKDPEATEIEIMNVLQKYNELSSEYPYIFIIGHASAKGIEEEPDLPYEELLRRNWAFAGERAAVIASLMQEHLSEEAKNRIVIVSTGQFDLRRPEDPEDPENAFVEVFFGNEWKPGSYDASSE